MLPKKIPEGACQYCLKLPELCVCEVLKPLTTTKHVLILQHPQEPDQDLGTARIAHLCLPSSTIKIGLSWPNLKAALGREAVASKWAVLYLGSGIKDEQENIMKPKQQATGRAADKGSGILRGSSLMLVDKKGHVMLNSSELVQELEGIVVLDGSWSQAKALWWRNAWLLKLRRAVLKPAKKSLYAELRKEPRRECLSTIESIAEAMDAMGEPAEISQSLRSVFSALLQKQRQKQSAGKP